MQQLAKSPDPIASRAVRRATASDAADIASLVNRAFIVERSFATGDRTTESEVRSKLATGEFLVLDQPSPGLAASIYVAIADGSAEFGLLAVDPELQGRGLGQRLVAVAEHLARAEGCGAMELKIVNLRDDLPPFYQRLGYAACGTAPFPLGGAYQPCHFIRMAKSLI